MDKVRSLESIRKLVTKYKNEGKTIVLVTGVYDILHIGHVRFLKKAKSAGDVLIVALDGDNIVRHIKGESRPINNEKIRAEVLECLEFIDLIFIFDVNKEPEFNDWLKVCELLRPDTLAVTGNDPLLEAKRSALNELDCQVKVVTPLIKNESTTRIAKLLGIE